MRIPTPPGMLRLLGPQPPLWQEARLGFEIASLRRDPIFGGRGVAHGNGQPVVLVPGFLAGDGSLGMMSSWLERTGYRPFRTGLRSHVGCSTGVVDRVERCVEGIATSTSSRVVIIGQSRGGGVARVLAVRRPDLVAGIVTLGTPHADPFAIHPLVLLQIAVVGALGTLGLPGLFKRSCFDGACCATVRDEFQADFPDEVPFVSIYSKRDGIVDWRACLDHAAEQVEISSSHCGMSAHPDAYRTIASALQMFKRVSHAAMPTGTSLRPTATVATAGRAA